MSHLGELEQLILFAVTALGDDRPPAPDIEAIAKLIATGALEDPCCGESN